MKICGIAFSYSENSMAIRGLSLMDHYLKFEWYGQLNDIPLCNSNIPDGNVPEPVEILWNKMNDCDAFVFSIPEASGHYSAAFKNVMDWFVVKSYFNADLGQKYPMSNKPVIVMTFTPVYKNAGGRHFDMTKHILEEKLGANVIDMIVKNDCWKHVVPNNFEFVKEECTRILCTPLINEIDEKPDMIKEVNVWQKEYEEWNNKWQN